MQLWGGGGGGMNSISCTPDEKIVHLLVVLCRLIEIIDNYRNLASIGSYRLEFSTID